MCYDALPWDVESKSELHQSRERESEAMCTVQSIRCHYSDMIGLIPDPADSGVRKAKGGLHNTVGLARLTNQ